MMDAQSCFGVKTQKEYRCSVSLSSPTRLAPYSSTFGLGALLSSKRREFYCFLEG
jgi:hypothetical protein